MSERLLSRPPERHEHDSPPWCEDCIARCSCGQYLHGVRVPVRTIYDGPQYQWRPISERKAKRIMKKHARGGGLSDLAGLQQPLRRTHGNRRLASGCC